MNEQEGRFLEELSKDRAESAEMLEKPSMRGIKKSVVEKYSDQAHFIYELLQNADDAHATKVQFILDPHRLIFIHDGTRLFSVSDPKTEEQDSEEGALGDINAITSIANSNKTTASIGKFGVGFKAVFQYTRTPHIYDPNFHFKIERFIVPVPLEEDHPMRQGNETLFVFPFDHPNHEASLSYEDIGEKLEHLSYPTLFLTELQQVSCQTRSGFYIYHKEIRRREEFGQTEAEQICLIQEQNGNPNEENLWLFSRCDKAGRRYSVGFFLDSKGQKIRPVQVPAFCFFPTKENTGLNFILHAPFLLTESREGIRAGIQHNVNMVHHLAKLTADAIVYLRDIGDREACRFIDDEFIKILPYDEGRFSHPGNKHRISFHPFYTAVLEIMKKEAVLPATNGYVSGENAYWAAATPLTAVFSDSQLQELCGISSAA